MPLRRVCLAVLVLMSPARPSLAADTPATVVDAFYKTYLRLRPDGLPSARQQKAMSPYLSEHLMTLMTQARAVQDRAIREHPDEKPPWADGCLFASLFEGPKRFKVSRVSQQADGSFRVDVHFWYEEGTPGWEDAVVVRKESGRWVIDDVLLSGAGPFNPPGKLSDNLAWRDK
jgi:Protein of unknown function (DUF3828)